MDVSVDYQILIISRQIFIVLERSILMSVYHVDTLVTTKDLLLTNVKHMLLSINNSHEILSSHNDILIAPTSAADNYDKNLISISCH